MAEYRYDPHCRYAPSHEWARIEDDLVVVGISDAAQDMMSDIVFVEVPEVGEDVTAGDDVAVVESVKSAEDVYAPVSGTVVAVNADLVDTPELVNDDPYGAWFFKIRPVGSLDEEMTALMDADAYREFVQSESH